MNKKQLIESMPRTMTRREVSEATGIKLEYVHAVCYRNGYEFKADQRVWHKTKADPEKVKEFKANPYSNTLKYWAEYLGISTAAVCRIRAGKAWGWL